MINTILMHIKAILKLSLKRVQIGILNYHNQLFYLNFEFQKPNNFDIKRLI